MAFFHVIIDYLYTFYEISTKILHLFLIRILSFYYWAIKVFRVYIQIQCLIYVLHVFSLSLELTFFILSIVFLKEKFFFFNFDEVHICRVEMFEDQVINGVLGQVYLTGA